jgi:hypothetical protein
MDRGGIVWKHRRGIVHFGVIYDDLFVCGGYRRNVEVTCVAVMRSLLSDGAGVPGSQVSGNVN